MKVDLAAEADRVEDRRVRISNSVEFIGIERSADLTALQETGRLDLAKAHSQDQVEMAPWFAEREPWRSEQAFRRLRLEYPPHALFRLYDGDRRIAIITRRRSQRVALGQH